MGLYGDYGRFISGNLSNFAPGRGLSDFVLMEDLKAGKKKELTW